MTALMFQSVCQHAEQGIKDVWMQLSEVPLTCHMMAHTADTKPAVWYLAGQRLKRGRWGYRYNTECRIQTLTVTLNSKHQQIHHSAHRFHVSTFIFTQRTALLVTGTFDSI